MPIVRYRNRKMYDLGEHRYVVLEEVAEKMRRDDVLTVTDHATGRDITARVLAECIWEEERRRPHLDAGRLAEVIRTGVVPGEEARGEEGR
jgi:polyhydroxyalkanoate synthesis regulator protein